MSVNTLINDGKDRHSLLPGHAWAGLEGFVNPGDLHFGLPIACYFKPHTFV